MKHFTFLDLATVNNPIEQQLKDAACSVISSGRYILGENVTALEGEIAALCQAKYCVAVSNGLDALRLIIRAYREMGVFNDDDEIIVPANTYVASVLAVSDNALVPCFVDPDEETLNLDCSRLEQYMNRFTRAIMPVHLYGTPCWSKQLNYLSSMYHLKIIEDNAQAIGAESATEGLNGTKVTGGLGDAAAISFYPTKNLGALGDAGAVVTNDKELADIVRALANYGSDRRYHNIYLGLNCRLDEIQAAMLRVKLPYLAAENDRRASIARVYNDNINNPAIIKPNIFSDMKQVWHQYVLRAKSRDKFRAFLLENGVETDVSYPTPPHLQPCYRMFHSKRLPIAQTLCDEVVSLPIARNITEDDAIQISDIINRFQ
ncbi:MAG: DegT/DnrJ/EryC1/StrS family aminotransferase [Muribaculaceae bacterium]|jgi:dTDP-4-amino-4,6-dideoxygalactose transaminase|nr:DegT/DnrJ/EryC1/StrS family aminotransferase [Muribaculaceae bacterium]